MKDGQSSRSPADTLLYQAPNIWLRIWFCFHICINDIFICKVCHSDLPVKNDFLFKSPCSSPSDRSQQQMEESSNVQNTQTSCPRKRFLIIILRKWWGIKVRKHSRFDEPFPTFSPSRKIKYTQMKSIKANRYSNVVSLFSD